MTQQAQITRERDTGVSPLDISSPPLPVDGVLFEQPIPEVSTPEWPIPSTESIDWALENLFPPETRLAKIQRSNIGDISLSYATWGDKRTIDDIKKYARENDLLTSETEAMLHNTGFPEGYAYPPHEDPFSPEFQARQAVYAATLAYDAIVRRGWDGVDKLIISSASTTADTPKRVERILAGLGIDVETALFYGQACNGATAAMIDSCRIAKQTGETPRTIVIGLESLSGKYIPPDNIQMVRTFGNGAGAIAFIAGKEIEHIVGSTVADKDEHAVITAPPLYKYPTEGHLPPPPGYEILANAQDVFATTEDGVFMMMPRPIDKYASMNGRRTFQFFSERVPPLAARVLLDYYQRFYTTYGPLTQEALGHQPSFPVAEGINRSLDNILTHLKENGLYEQPRKDIFLSRGDVPSERIQPDLSVPWMMDQAGVNNISAGASLVMMTEMAKTGRIHLDKPTLLLGYGIGAVYQADVIMFHKAS